MALSIANYTKAIRSTLNVALCIREFPSELVEKHIKPEIEVFDTHKDSRPLIFQPITISRSEKERCLIEGSVNSVRVSFTIKKSDDLERLIVGRFSAFFGTRAELYEIVRKKPIEGYDVSFLILNSHLEKFNRDMIIDFLVEFIESVEKDISEIKLNINTQTRIAATFFINAIANPSANP
eukprot:TRINITY_DN3774_c0_g1_i1.p1 TRINITY_DN3774_c0_g1~~TRINITY_DN3774_c0_g1_i1.p1  ORF type:complete len:180 (+),score=48.52 TRINITY_DN3774_c0_g1_i1:110-649(+)